MKMPCDQRITCPCDELPLSNYSAEDPDRRIFLGRYYGDPGKLPCIGCDGPPTTGGCVSFSDSLANQDDADWCAIISLAECEVASNLNNPCWVCRGTGGSAGLLFGFHSSNPSGDPCCDPNLPEDCCCQSEPSDPSDPPPDGDKPPDDPDDPNPPPRLYCNDPQSCTVSCGPGKQPFTATIEHCRFQASSKAMANRMAYSAACQMAREYRICTDDNWGGGNACKVVCQDQYFELQLQATSQQDLDLTWSVTSGSLPEGVQMDDTGNITGTPTSGGESTSATVTIDDGLGHTHDREICFSVMGIQNDGDLGTTKVDQPYTGQVSATGGFAPYVYASDDLPAWLTMTAAGALSGTPDTVGGNDFTVRVTDNLSNTCEFACTLEVLGPKIFCPSQGTVCVFYNDDVTADPPGCLFTGTVPSKLVLTPGGNISGIPTTPGSFNIIATDPVTGQVNSKVCPGINPDPGEPAAAAQDMVWTGYTVGAPSPHCSTSGGGSGSGAVAHVYASGCCYMTGSWTYEGRGGKAEAGLKNCSGAGYLVTLSISVTFAHGGSCPFPAFDVYVGYNGGWTLLATGMDVPTWNWSGSYTLPNGVSDVISFEVDVRGDATANGTMTVSPATPP